MKRLRKISLTLLVFICVALYVTVFSYGMGLLLAVALALWLGGQFPIRQFGYEVNDTSSVESERGGEDWPVVYETNLDLAFAAMLAGRLRAEDIPVIEENKNLFNSGINWEFGLSVPLRIRVPEKHEPEAHEVVRSLQDSDEE